MVLIHSSMVLIHSFQGDSNTLSILEILKGGRGKLAKKSIGIKVVKNMYSQNQSVTVE